MAPTSEPTAPTKKSLRIWVKNNGHVIRKKTRVSYTYPRTVEAAKDPFECPSGKNKMFYLIAINLYPESKIVRPDDSESESEMEVTSQTDTADCNNMQETNTKIEMEENKLSMKLKRTKRSAGTDQASSEEESQISPHNYSSESEVTSEFEPVTSKNSCQRQRLLPLKKTSVKKKKKSNANVENKGKKLEVCSKVSDCENCLSSSEPVDALKSNKVGIKTVGTGLNARKLPAIPTIMNRLNKIIQTCSASGVVSFSLPTKKKPRDSRS